MTNDPNNNEKGDDNQAPVPQVARIVVMTSADPKRLSKMFKWDEEKGEIEKTSGGSMKKGSYEVMDAPDPESFVNILKTLKTTQATTYGLPKTDKQKGRMVSGKMKNGLARTRKNFAFPAGPAWMMFDIDMKGVSFDQIKEHFRKVIPGFDAAPAVFKHSSSSFIYKDDECLIGEGGKRVYLLVKDGQDISRAAKAIGGRLKINGTLHYEVCKAGRCLERCLIDEVVYQPERLDFSGRCLVWPPLRQKRPEAEIQNNDAKPYDTEAAIPDLSEDEESALEDMRPAEREKVKDKVIENGGRWVEERVKKEEERLGVELSTEAKEKMREKFRGIVKTLRLPEDFILHAQDGRYVTVGELLASPDIWDQQNFADPLEPDYNDDPRIAKAWLRGVESPHIYSHAHGGQRYSLVKNTYTFTLEPGDLPALVNQCMDVLHNERAVYQRGDELVRVAQERIYKLEEAWIQNRLEKSVMFQKLVVSDETPKFVKKDCPKDVPRRIMASGGEWPFDELKGLISLPIMRKDGSILRYPGYDRETGLILKAVPKSANLWDSIPVKPTAKQIKAALARLWKPFCLFPYKTPADVGVLLSYMFTMPTRAILPTAPAFLIRAPIYSSGKTFLATAVAAMAGMPYTVVAWPDQQAEQRKSLVSLLCGRPGTLIFDNLMGKWNSPDLAAILTGRSFTDRLLGVSQMIEVNTCSVFVGTGNNVIAGDDMARRVLVCNIDPQTDRPDQRSFKFKPEDLVNENLEQMRVDALTVLRGYKSAGRPEIKQRSFGSFEEWDGLVGQMICWIAENDFFPVEVDDPLESIAENYAEDPNTAKMHAFMVSWYAQFGEEEKTVAEVIELVESERWDAIKAKNMAFFDVNIKPSKDKNDRKSSDLYASLHEIAGKGAIIVSRILGNWMGKNKDRIVKGYRIEKAPMLDGYIRWKVVKVEEGSSG